MDERERLIEFWQSRVARVNRLAALLGYALLAAVIGFFVLPAPYIPFGDAKLDVPDSIALKDERGEPIVLRPSERDSFLQWDIEKLPEAIWLDTQSHAVQNLKISDRPLIVAPQHLDAGVRFKYLGKSGKEIRAFDPEITYYVDLPEERVDPIADKELWPLGVNQEFTADDPAIRGISHWNTRGAENENGQRMSRWEFRVSFDLIKAYELGRTDIPAPIHWYGSTFFVIFNALPRWILAIAGPGLIVTLIYRSYSYRQLNKAWY